MENGGQMDHSLIFKEGYDASQSVAERFQDSALRELKSAVLAIDWEITDSILLKFSEEVHDLQDLLRHDSYSLLLLQILEVLGKYIRIKQADAHPLSIHILQSSYDTLEEFILEAGGMPDGFKKKKVSKVLADYKKLKSAITQGAKANGNGSGGQDRAEASAGTGEPGAKASEDRPEQDMGQDQEQADDQPSAAAPEPGAPAMENLGPEMQVLLANLRSMLREELRAFRQEMLREIEALRAQE